MAGIKKGDQPKIPPVVWAEDPLMDNEYYIK